MFKLEPYIVPFRLESGKIIAISIQVSAWHEVDTDDDLLDDIKIDIASGNCLNLLVQVEASYLHFCSTESIGGCLVLKTNLVQDVKSLIDEHGLKRLAVKDLVDTLRDTHIHLTDLFTPDRPCGY